MGESDTTEDGTDAQPTARLAAVTNENVLVSGPPLAGKSGFALDVVGAARRAGREVLLVTTTQSAPQLLADRNAADPTHVVDCTPVDVPETEGVTDLASPADLTGISMPLSAFLTEATSPVLVFDSASTLLMYTEEADAFRFLSVLTTHVRNVGGLGLFTLDAGSHSERTVRTFAQLFGGRIDLRADGDRTEVKATGVAPLPDEWTPL